MSQTDPELARVIDRVRSARAGRAPLYISGGGTKIFYGEQPVGESLDLTGVKGISCYEPTELVVTVRAGTALEELESALEEHGQCLPFEPPRFAPGGTVGGMVAAGLSGPARANVGAVRDHVLGVTLLNGLGEVLSFGGQVAKNVAGYDVSRLMAGSLGVLGVICEVSLKVLPTVRATATLCFDWEEDRALRQLRDWNSQPLPLNASAWCEGRLHVRLGGAAAAVDAACARLGGTPLAPDAAASWWRSARDQTREFFSLDAGVLARGECLWRLSLPPNTGPVRLPGRQFIEWHGAQRWWRTPAAAGVVRAVADQAGGHATLIRGADKSGGVFTPVGGALLRVHRALKQSFDPDGVFNRGRLYAEL
jgi:glycolate oxidase FAD binding subunit